MMAEDVARRFEKRAGFDLIDYAEVALPLYRLTVDVITMVHREVPPISEFVIKSINAGLSERADIAGFLGLDDATITATVQQLYAERYVSLSEDNENTALLERGRSVIAKGGESSPQDETIVFLYDRVLRRPLWMGAETLLAPSQIDPQKIIEIRPYPAEGPEISDLGLAEIRDVLQRKHGGKIAFGKDILKLKKILRRVRLYREAVALVYKKHRSSDIQIAFIVDDARHENLEHAFAASGGPKRMGFFRAIDESATATALRRHLGTDVQHLLPDIDVFEEKRTKASTARLKYQIALNKAERLKRGSPEAHAASGAIEAAEKILLDADATLKSLPARPIAPYEIPELMKSALADCRNFFAASSLTLGRHIVHPEFLKSLDTILMTGATVVISLGRDALASLKPVKGRFDPNIELEKLAHKHPRLTVRLKWRSEFHHLIVDDRFAAVVNVPLLGNRRKVRGFEHVAGYLLQSPELVRAYRRRVTGHADDLDLEAGNT